MSKRRNPNIPSERAMEMDDRSNIEREESKAKLTQRPRKRADDQETIKDIPDEAPAEKRDDNQPDRRQR